MREKKQEKYYLQGMSKKKGTLLKLALAKKFKSNSFEISIT